MRHPKTRFSVVFAFVFTVSTHATGATFSDADFGTHWFSGFGFVAGNTFFVGIENRSSGGNPGAYRYTDQLVNDSNISNKEILVPHFYGLQTYDPSAGPIENITISFDAKANLVDSLVPGTIPHVQFGAAILQDNKGFIHDPGASARITDQQLNNWFTFTFSNLTATDFVRSDGTADDQVDFSLSGAPINFGYYAYVRKQHSQLFTARAQTGVDNWSVTVNSVPEPSALVLLAVSILIFLGKRSR